MFENIVRFFKKLGKNEKEDSKTTAKERLHLVLAQDRANISADFLEMMKQEIIEVIKKYVDIDEGAIDVRMTNKPGEDGTVGAPALYANIPIVTIKNEARKLEGTIEKNASNDEQINKEKESKEIVEIVKENVENKEEEISVEDVKNSTKNEIKTEKKEEKPQVNKETKTVNTNIKKTNTNKSKQKKNSKKK